VRVYRDFREAKNEIRRDLAELGTRVVAGYQSKKLINPDELATKELTGYDYRVLMPVSDELDPVQPWAKGEWQERLLGIHGEPVNPGKAWTLRPEIWTPLLEGDGKFSYTYSERMVVVPEIIAGLKRNPASRQAWLSIWDPAIDTPRLGDRRVPCTLGYQFLYRKGALDIEYHMRSSDFATHFDNDIWLACMLQQYVANAIEQPVGQFVHVLGSLHMYENELRGIF